MHAAVVQHLEGVARAVADGKHHMVRFEPLAGGKMQRAHAAIVDFHVGDPGLEADFAAQFLDRGPHQLHHLHQPEGADVRLADIQDFRRRLGLDELGQHLAAVMLRVLHLGPQLAVRKRAGAAFAELHVRLRVQDPLAPQAESVLGSFSHRLAALENNGLEAHLRQDQSGEQSARAHAYHHGAVGQASRCLRDVVVAGVRRGLQRALAGMAAQQRGFVLDFDVYCVDQRDRALAARVIAAAKHGEAQERFSVHAKASQYGLLQCSFGMVEGELYIDESQHAQNPVEMHRSRYMQPVGRPLFYRSVAAALAGCHDCVPLLKTWQREPGCASP